jgi:hypothetical protein
MADRTLDILRREALWFEPTADGVHPLVDAVENARLVLIGEATSGPRCHGTHS